MKKLATFAISALLSCCLYAAEPAAVTEKVLQAFEQSFKTASAVVWHEYDDRYEVKFLHNAIDSRITYDKEGNILRTIRYYAGEQLPLMICAKLQKQHPGKKVFGVTELSAEGEVDYFIVLEDKYNWHYVKCSPNGSMSTYQKYRKA